MRPAGWIRRHWFAASFLALLVGTEITTALLPAAGRAAVAAWASTSVTNLAHHPVPALVTSAFVNDGHPLFWPALTLMGLVCADRVLRPARSALLCGFAHLLGTGVSEGIQAFRVHAGGLPRSALSQLDVGSSYVVVTALAVALVAGTWLVRAVASVGLATVGPYLFVGLSHLDVSAVGHAVALVCGALAGCWVALRRLERRGRCRSAV